MGRPLSLLAVALAGVSWSAAPRAEGTPGQDCLRDAVVVFDGSGSMAEMGFNLLEEPRIFEAREAVHAAVPKIAAVRRLGLIVYGPGTA